MSPSVSVTYFASCAFSSSVKFFMPAPFYLWNERTVRLFFQRGHRSTNILINRLFSGRSEPSARRFSLRRAFFPRGPIHAHEAGLADAVAFLQGDRRVGEVADAD